MKKLKRYKYNVKCKKVQKFGWVHWNTNWNYT